MGDKLRPKYMVHKIIDTIPGTGTAEKVVSQIGMPSTDPDDVDSPFVLMPRKDPAAFYALLNYAQACEDDLAREIRNWLEKIVKAPPVFGSQGLRNRVAMKLKQMDMISQ